MRSMGEEGVGLHGHCVTRVLLVDDHHMVAVGLAAVVADEDDIEVVGVTGTLRGSLDLARAFAPDVVVLDYRLPDGEGAEGIRKLRALPRPPRVLVLTAA